MVPLINYIGTKMSSIQTLLEQQAAINKQIDDLRRSERADAIKQVKDLMAQYGLSPQDIGSANMHAGAPKAKGTRATAGTKVAAKFRDPASGNSWSGRGLTPKWLKAATQAGRKIEEFAV